MRYFSRSILPLAMGAGLSLVTSACETTDDQSVSEETTPQLPDTAALDATRSDDVSDTPATETSAVEGSELPAADTEESTVVDDAVDREVGAMGIQCALNLRDLFVVERREIDRDGRRGIFDDGFFGVRGRKVGSLHLRRLGRRRIADVIGPRRI